MAVKRSRDNKDFLIFKEKESGEIDIYDIFDASNYIVSGFFN